MNSDYFVGVGTKPIIKNEEPFKYDDSRPDLLLQWLSDHKAKSTPNELQAMDNMMIKWIFNFMTGFNVAVRGPQSKYRLLETFKARYLDSNELLDWQIADTRSKMNITTVRMHGNEPIKMEQFLHGVFNFKESGRYLRDDDVESFLESAKVKRMHYVFMIHSYELFYESCKQICELIYRLYEQNRDLIHIIVSLDHVNCAKIIQRLRYRFSIYEFHGESFVFERSTSISLMDEAWANKKNNLAGDTLFQRQMDLRSLHDIHQAIPDSCQKIMIYILTEFVNKREKSSKMLNNFEDTLAGPMPRRQTRGVSKKKSHVDEPTDESLDFRSLFEYCESEFIVRRADTLRANLRELTDHELIELDDTGNKILCLVDGDTCKKFLEDLKSIE